MTTTPETVKDRLILIPNAIKVAARAAEAVGLSVNQEKALRIASVSYNTVETPRGPALKMKDLQAFVKNFVQSIKFHDSSYLAQPRGLAVDRVVGIEEFIDSKEYMDQAAACRPAVKEGLIELFDSPRSDGYIECCLTGSERWGKSYSSYLAIPYMVYKLSCFHNPQLEYDLAPGSPIIFILQSKRYELSKKVLFEEITGMIRRSPYFMKFFPFDTEVKSELRFPKNIYILPMGGSDTAAIGMNIFGGAVDEMNYMAKVRYSERFESALANEREYDQAERIYEAIIGRMRGTFMRQGRLPGKLLLISASNYPGDFTDRKIAEAKKELEEYGKTSILVLKHTQWEVMPKDRYSGEKFLVELGNVRKPARIIHSLEEAVDKEDIIEVPAEYRLDFERDLPSAIKRYVGITTEAGKSKFIPYPELIQKAQDEYVKLSGGKSLFRFQDVIIDKVVDPGAPDWDNLVDLDYIHECVADPMAPFAFHIDLAKSENAAGLAVGRLFGYKMLPSSKYYDVKAKDFVEVRDLRMPVYMIDGVLRIVPPPSGRQIDFDMIRDLMLWLRGHLYLKWGSMDVYQSVMMIQAFRKVEIRSGVLSVDTSIAPYTELKLAIKDERIYYPPHEMLSAELKNIEKEKERDKIIHPTNGSKDVSDAVSGVVFMLQSKEAVYGAMGRGRESARRRVEERVVPTEGEIRHINIGGTARERRRARLIKLGKMAGI